MNELKITKERILSAAKKCPSSEMLLKELFPEAFEENEKIDLTKLEVNLPENGIGTAREGIFKVSSAINAGFPTNTFVMWVRVNANFPYSKQAFVLSSCVDWRIQTCPRNGSTLLIPSNKAEKLYR